MLADMGKTMGRKFQLQEMLVISMPVRIPLPPPEPIDYAAFF
jgi:hypothetical protein